MTILILCETVLELSLNPVENCEGSIWSSTILKFVREHALQETAQKLFEADVLEMHIRLKTV